MKEARRDAGRKSLLQLSTAGPKVKQKELRSDDGKATWLAEGECPSICGK